MFFILSLSLILCSCVNLKKYTCSEKKDIRWLRWMLRMQKFQEIMCFHRHFKVFCLDLKPKTHQNNINSDFIGLLGFVCNFYFVKFAQICCADSIALAREHGIERKHCARLFTLAYSCASISIWRICHSDLWIPRRNVTIQPTNQPASQSAIVRFMYGWLCYFHICTILYA